jgi:hypothetical protein
MGGAHRSTTQRRAASALKSAAWLLAVATVLIIFPGLLVLGIYLAVAHPADARPLAIAVQGAGWAAVFGHLTWVVFRERAHLPAQLVHLIGEGFLLLCATAALLCDVGDRLGWTHGPFRYAMTGVNAVLLLAIGTYWLFGRRRLRAVLGGQAAARDDATYLS